MDQAPKPAAIFSVLTVILSFALELAPAKTVGQTYNRFEFNIAPCRLWLQVMDVSQPAPDLSPVGASRAFQCAWEIIGIAEGLEFAGQACSTDYGIRKIVQTVVADIDSGRYPGEALFRKVAANAVVTNFPCPYQLSR